MPSTLKSAVSTCEINPILSYGLSVLAGNVAVKNQFSSFNSMSLRFNSSNCSFNMRKKSFCSGVDGIVVLAASDLVLKLTYPKKRSNIVSYFIILHLICIFFYYNIIFIKM